MPPVTPLAGLRVLEVTGWNGVLAGRLLADGGADVVRVVPLAGDLLAAEPPFFGDSGQSIQAAWYNAGKRVLAVDLGAGPGRARFLDLVAAADLLIEDWPPGGSFSDDELRAANPRLARVSVTPAGEDGPWAHLATNDLVQNALSGAASVTGDVDTPPLTGYGNQSYHAVGLYAAAVALATLRAARLTGLSQHAVLSAHEALVTCTEQVLMQWWFPEGIWNGPVARRQGALHWSGAYAVYPGRDGRGVMVTVALNFLSSLLPWLREEDAAQGLTDAEKFPDAASMLANIPYLMKVMRDFVAAHDGDDFFYEAQRRHQPFGAVWDIGTAVESLQLGARRYLTSREVAGFGPVSFPSGLFRLNGEPVRPSLPQAIQPHEAGWRPRPAPAGQPRSLPAGRPLEGVRILDFTHVLAGPFGTRVLADLGAEVLKVSTASRAIGSNMAAHPYYVCWNRNKQSVCINMAMQEGRDLARALAGKSDALIENFSAGVLHRWGLDRASLSHEHPGISVISMAGMGQDGPWKDFVTFAPTLHALTGLTYLSGIPGRADIGYGFSLSDHLCGLTSAVALLEGLEHRERTGEGLEIDLAQYEVMLGMMAPGIMDHLANGTDPAPTGNRHPFGAWAPHGIYRALGDDRWVAIAARGNEQWQALSAVIGRPELASDTRFATHAARLVNADALDATIEDWTRTRDRYEVMATCQAAGLPAGAVQDAEDLAARDPQLAAREFFGTASSERWGSYGIDRFPARFNGCRPPVYEGVHEVGEDTFTVFSGLLGLPDHQVADLIARGVLG